MRIALRVGLLSLLALLVLTALGGGALAARNLFDDDYQDCPAGVRVARLTGVKAVRTDKDDELKVEWDAAPWASWNLQGGTAEITVLVESKDRTKTLQKSDKALGATSTTFKNVDLATDWVVQVAVTDRKKVISDIVEVEFTSGIKKPLFFSGLYYEVGHTTKLPAGVTAGSEADKSDNEANRQVGSFYYLGFNRYFDNWYAEGLTWEVFDRNGDGSLTGPGNAYPAIPKFRVGLRHDVANPGDADFDHFRLRVADSDGDDLLGFDAATVVDSFYQHGTQEFAMRVSSAPPASLRTSNWAESNRLHNDGQRVAALHESPTNLLPWWLHNAELWTGSQLDIAAVKPDFTNAGNRNAAACLTAAHTQIFNGVRVVEADLTYAGLRTFTGTEVDATPEYYLYAELPHQIYDLPQDLFGRDGTYTLTAWAADDKDNPISPRATLTFSIQEPVNDENIWVLLDYVANKPTTLQQFLSTSSQLVRQISGSASGLYYDNGGTPGDPSDDTCGIDTPRLSPVPSSRSYNTSYYVMREDTFRNSALVNLTVTQR